MKDVLFDGLHKGIGQVLDLRSQQSSLTAGNIANADTPHYKAKFIQFDEVLQNVMGSSSMSLKQTHQGHLGGLFGDTDNPEIEEIEAPPWVMDGNSVQLEREMVRMESNALQYSSVTRGLSKRLAMLRYVVSEGR